jgi:hypothetical protein
LQGGLSAKCRQNADTQKLKNEFRTKSPTRKIIALAVGAGSDVD